MRLKGEEWDTFDGRKLVIVEDMPNGWLKILNERGKLEVIQENFFRNQVNKNVGS